MDIRNLTQWLVVMAIVTLVAAGCGRSALQSGCETDEDCGAGMNCEQNACVTVDEQFDPQEGDEHTCSDDLDCGDGICRVDGDDCRQDVCNEQTGYCETADCTPECGENEQRDGCECVPAMCEDDDDCGDQICGDGQCRPCASDAECSDDGSRVCSQGVCEENIDCTGDDDCRPHEMCQDQQCVHRPECTFDDDCGEDERCVGGVCTYTPDCEDDADCGQQAECVGGSCQAKVCRGNDECPDDQLCDAGDCVDPPVALSCEIVTESQTIAPGETVALQAFAYDAQGNGVAASFSWTSSDSVVAQVEGDELVGGNAYGATEVTATLVGGDPISCQGEPTFFNPGPTSGAELRVGVRHMETGAVIEGAEVHVEDEMAITDTNGFAELSAPEGEYDVSVFHDDYNYITVRGVESDDIRIPLTPKSGTGPIAGFTGEYDTTAINTSGDVELGMAGASLAGDLLDLDLEQLFGDPFHTEFDLFGMGGDPIPIPGALTAHGDVFGQQIEGKSKYYVQSADGPRLGWGIAGEVPFQDLLGLFSNPPDDVASAIAAVLPLFSRFDHAQQPMVLDALPRVLDSEDINNSGDTSEWLPDYQSFPEYDLMPSVRQDLSTEVVISKLPQLNGEQAQVAVLLGGTRAEDLGVVPLGISAVADEDGDGQPDSQTLYMAPPYGSAVGGRYTVVALSFAGADGDVEEGPGALGADFSMALWNGQSMPTQTMLGTFPDSSSGFVDDETRQVVVEEASAGPIFRARLVDEERTWDVWSTGVEESPGEYSIDVDVPDVPPGWNDLFDAGDEFYIDAINTSVAIDDLVSASGVGLNRAGLVTPSFNRTTLE